METIKTSEIKLAALQRDKKMMAILTELRQAKKKLEKLKLAIEDASKIEDEDDDDDEEEDNTNGQHNTLFR